MRKTLLTLTMSAMLLGGAHATEMPDNVLASVKDAVAKRYPDNYSLQETLIDAQIESYMFLQSYAPDGVPPDVLAKIKTNVASRYPDNFSLQQTLVEAQVKSYRKLNG